MSDTTRPTYATWQREIEDSPAYAMGTEAVAYEMVERLVHLLAEVAVEHRIWRIGDGYGGWIIHTLREAVDAAGGQGHRPPPTKSGKAAIPAKLRWEVFKRDGFTCVDCGAQDDLAADHVIAESKGGPTTLENLATRCRPCNSRKGTR